MAPTIDGTFFFLYLGGLVIGVAALYAVIRFAVRDGIRDARKRSAEPPAA